MLAFWVEGGYGMHIGPERRGGGDSEPNVRHFEIRASPTHAAVDGAQERRPGATLDSSTYVQCVALTCSCLLQFVLHLRFIYLYLWLLLRRISCPHRGACFFVDKLLNLDALLLVLSGLSSLEKLMCIIRESKKCTL